MIATILPEGVESAECFGAGHDGGLFLEEANAVAAAVEPRRREHATVRRCAREGLRRLGFPDQPIPVGAGGAPQWPVGVRGSMTHCPGYAAAAVGRADGIAAIGIDAEPDAPLPPGVLDLVATPDERRRLTAMTRGPTWDRLLFSAKEAVYKAWFPVVGDWLDHHEVEVVLEPQGDSFTAVLSRPGLVVDGDPVTRLRGRWVRGRGLLLVAVWW